MPFDIYPGIMFQPVSQPKPTTLTLAAQEQLTRFSVVVVDDGIYRASNTVIAHASMQLGITTEPGFFADNIPVQVEGLITNLNWNWVDGVPIFLGANGALTQTMPQTGFIRVVGYPREITSMYFSPQIAITRSA